MRQPDQLKTDQRLTWSPGKGTEVWELLCSCCSGDISKVKALIDRDPSLVNCHCAYRTPIYFAVRENRLEVVKYLLERGADPLSLAYFDSHLQIAIDRGYQEMEQTLRKRLKELHGASEEGEKLAELIRSGDAEAVETVLNERPELVHAGDSRSNQPIHWATMTRRIDFLDLILARGGDINAKRQDGARPIHLFNGDYHFRGWRDVPRDWKTSAKEMLNALLERGAECDLCTACHMGDFDLVKKMVSADPASANRVSDYVSYYLGGGAPITNAAKAGHIEIVKYLLKMGADPNLEEVQIAPHGHALYSAAANGNLELAKLLLEHGAYPNPEVESSADALSRAIDNDDKPMVELLCSYGAARDVHLLAYYGDVQTAAAVFAANPALANDSDALANAAGQGNEPFVRLMLRYCPELPKEIEFPSWLVAAKTREINELLFEHGMNPSQSDWMRVTPLHRLAQKGDIETARLFLEHGADIHARDEEICSTPLGWAAKYGQLEMVKFLLGNGAMPIHSEDPSWATPIAWAERRGHAEIAELLLSFNPASRIDGS